MTRVSSYDKSFILRQEFHPTTRVLSYDKSFILRQEFHPTTRVGWLENVNNYSDGIGDVGGLEELT